MSIVEEQTIGLESGRAAELRRLVSAWSNKVPFHPYRDFGDAIQIRAVSYRPVYLIHLKTQFHSEQNQRKERPYSQGVPYARTSREPAGSGGIYFVRKASTYTVAGSEQVCTCGSCNGRGRNSCGNCSGSGKTQCYQCSGSGKCSSCGGGGRRRCYACNAGKVSCSACGGSGTRPNYNSYAQKYEYAACYSCNRSGQQACSQCGGAASTMCTGCIGSGSCSGCTSGKVQCSGCGGRGSITCSGCAGCGQIVRYTERTEKWDFNALTREVFSPVLQADFPSFKTKADYSREPVFEKSASLLDENLFDDEPLPFRSGYRELLPPGRSAGRLDVDQGACVVHQQVEVARVPVFQLSYTHRGDNFQLLVISKDGRVFEENGPIARYRQDLTTLGKKYLLRRNFGKSAEYLEQAAAMDLEDQDPKLKRMHKKAKRKIRASYQLGAFMGAWLLAYPLSLWLLHYLTTPRYALGVLNRVAVQWGSDFIVVNNLLLVLLFCGLSLTQSVQRTGRSLFAGLDRKVQPEGLRYAAGFLTSLPGTGLVATTLLLLNATGILMPLSVLVWQLTAWLLPGLSLPPYFN